MIGLVQDLLARQNPAEPHTLRTRILVSLCISFAYIVLYGFYGLIGCAIAYLVGVELMGLPMQWMLLPLFVGVLLGMWKSLSAMRDYWRNFGHGD